MYTPIFFNYFSGRTFNQGLRVKVGTNVHVSDLAYADDIVLPANNYRGMQNLLETVNISMHINASKTKVMSALIPGEQHQAVLLEGEPLEEVDKL